MQIFEFYEKCAQEKRIQYYGITANQSLRLNEKIKRDLQRKSGWDDDRYNQQLYDLILIAEKVGGKNHRFKFI